MTALSSNQEKYKKSTNLHPYFRQINFHRQLLPRVHIGIMALFESPLQLVQLVRGEGRPVPAVLFLVSGRSRRRLLVAACGLVFGGRLEAIVAVAGTFACNTQMRIVSENVLKAVVTKGILNKFCPVSSCALSTENILVSTLS